MSSTVSTLPLPGEAIALGSPLGEYGPQTRQMVISGIFFLVVGLAFIGIAVGISSGDPDALRGMIICGTIGVIFLGMAVYQLALAVINRNLRIVVLDRGVARILGGKVEVVRWADVASVYQKVTDHYRNGVRTNTTHVYTVHLENGRKVVFNDVIRDVKSLGDTIQREVSVVLLPKFGDTLSSGGTLHFNKLQMSQAGIGTSKEIVPWHEIDSVRLNRGVIQVSSHGKVLNWATQMASATPNLLVFMTLVERIKGGRSA